ERLAGAEADLGSHRGVADRALADELRISARIALVDADGARRERIAKPLLARAREAQHAVGAFRLLARVHPVVAIFIGPSRRRVVDVEEADLLGLLIGDRRPLGERIEIEIAEPLPVRRLGARLANRRGR